MNYLIEIEPRLQALEREHREHRLAYARLCAEARLPGRGHPILGRTGQLLTRAGSWLESWAAPRAARTAQPARFARDLGAKKVVTPC